MDSLGLVPRGFRRSIKTTELWGTVFSILVLFCLGPALLPYVVAGLATSFMVSRALYKKNRAITLSSFLSAEFGLCLVSHITTLYCMVEMGLPREKAALLFLAVQAIYNVTRGWAKGVGIKIQTIMR